MARIKQLNFRVTKQEDEAIQKAADKLGIGRAELIRRIFQAYLRGDIQI